jgi:hypothetical protein
MAVEVVPSVIEEGFVKEEVTYDTPLATVAVDAIKHVRGTFKIEDVVNFEPLDEACGTASHQGEVQTNQGGTFAMQTYVKPQAAGTSPDITALLKAAMGKETIVGGTSVAYTLSDTEDLISLQGMLHVEGHWQKKFNGGVVEQMKITIPSNGKPTFEFTGSIARAGFVKRDVCSATEPGAETSIAIADASRGSVKEPCEMIFDTDNNAGAGYLVTAHDWTAGAATFTVSPGLAVGVTAGDDILPFAPAQTTGGTVIAAVNNTLTFGALSLGFISCTVTVNTGLALQDEEGSSDRSVGIVRKSKRMIETEWQFYVKDTNAGNTALFGLAHEGFTHDVDLTVGNSSENQMKLSWPKARLDIVKEDTAEADVMKASAKMIARQSAAAADEFSILFD